MRDIEGLKTVDRETKPQGADQEWSRLYHYYIDQGRSATSEQLRRMGAGISTDKVPHPIEAQLLRRVVDRLAVIYDRPPVRWLANSSGSRLSDSNAEHKAMVAALERSQYNLAWRKVDRLRTLMRQEFIRFYPSPSKRTVIPRLFAPFNVLRDVSPSCPDTVDEDRAIALCVGKRGGFKELWEFWRKEQGADGPFWSVAYVDEGGGFADEQPFDLADAEAAGIVLRTAGGSFDGFRVPYGELPIVQIFDDYPGGQAWLPPRMSRTGWVESINAISNDLWNLIFYEAHSIKVMKSDDPSALHQETGPNTVVRVGADNNEDFRIISQQPNMQESREILEYLVRLWTLSEDLPASEFDRHKQVVTGAARRVESAPLLARREAQVPLAEMDERLAYEKFRAVHNYHREDGWVRTLVPDRHLEVDIPDLDIPEDTQARQEANSRALALGTKSMIDVIMEDRGCPRHQAIKLYERIREDSEKYPSLLTPETDQSGLSGPRMTAPSSPAEMVGVDSQVGAIAETQEPERDAPEEDS